MTKSVKEQCHDLRNEVHAELKDFQGLVTKVKNLEDLQSLSKQLKNLKLDVKSQTLKRIQDSFR